MTERLEPGAEDQDLDESGDDSKSTRRVLWFAAAIVLVLLVRSFMIEPVRVRSDSMAPTLRPGALLLVDKLTFHARDPRRGDIVIAHDPRTGGSIVKRVVAVGGDSVGIDDGVLTVNGSRVIESYVDNDNMDGYYFGPDVVPPDHVFLLGDNRANSEDSRAYGPVPVDDIDGKALIKVWPVG